MNNSWREKIVQLRNDYEDEYITNLIKLAGYASLDEIFDKGIPITELEPFGEEASLITWGDSKPNRYWRWPCREVISNRIIERFGSTKAYQNSPQFIKHKTEKIENTNKTVEIYSQEKQEPQTQWCAWSDFPMSYLLP